MSEEYEQKELNKIMFATSNMRRGGAQRRVSILCNSFAEKGIDVCLVYTGDYATPSDYPLDSKVEVFYSRKPSHEFLRKILKLLPYLQLTVRLRASVLRRKIKEYNPEAIVVFKSAPINTILLATKGLNIPIIYAVVRSLSNKVAHFDDEIRDFTRAFDGVNGIVFQTEVQKKMFYDTMVINRQVIQTVINNPIEESAFWNIPRERIKEEIITAGRLGEIKNYPLLINAFSEVVKNHPTWRLIIYGEGDQRENLEQLILDLNMQNKISLPGMISNIDEKLHEAAIFVLPSNSEGLPNALIEAMCMGLPSIATDCDGGGARELIEDEVNGLLIPKNDITALVQVLERLIDDEELRESLGEHAKNTRERLSKESIIEKWIDFIDFVIRQYSLSDMHIPYN